MKVIKTKKLLHNKARKIVVLPKNAKMFLLVILFIIGILFGALSVRFCKHGIFANLNTWMLALLSDSNHQSILYNSLESILFNFLLLSIPCLFGLCLIGEPFLWSYPCFRGCFVGVFVGLIYKNFATQGLLYFLTVLMVPMVLNIAISIVACQESILTSRDFRGAVYAQKDGNGITKLYIVRYAVLFGITLCISFLSAILMYLFSSKFTLF